MKIYHVTTRTDWDHALAEGFYRRSTRGKSFEDVGFIHGSLSDQLSEVAEFVYADCDQELLVLVMDLARLEDLDLPVRFEDGGNGTQYPHIYAPLPCPAVDGVRAAWFDAQGHFVVAD